MDKFLRINLRSLCKEYELYLTEKAFKDVEISLNLTLSNSELMGSWRKAIDEVQKRDMKVGSCFREGRLASTRPVSSAYHQGRDDYLIADKNGYLFYLNGMHDDNSKFVPKYSGSQDVGYHVTRVTSINMGSYLSGINSGTIEGAKRGHQIYKEGAFKRLQSSLGWYKRDFKDSVENCYLADMDYYNECSIYKIEDSLLLFTRLLWAVGMGDIPDMPNTSNIISALDLLNASVKKLKIEVILDKLPASNVVNVLASEEYKMFMASLDDFIELCSNYEIELAA